MKREYYSATIADFIKARPEEIIGQLVISSEFPPEKTQQDAWLKEISILKEVLAKKSGSIYFEYSIPRMGKRIDVVVVVKSVIFVLEFKVGEDNFTLHAIDQVWDYALDLKNFHETSHDCYVAPILVATQARTGSVNIAVNSQNDKVFLPVKVGISSLRVAIDNFLNFSEGLSIDIRHWEQGRYSPTPTIVEAAIALYRGHAVNDISRNDASAINLTKTSDAITNIINRSKANNRKSICFVTGVPGAGKTLVGLNIANEHIDKDNELYSVFLSGNGPLVTVLREALARDSIDRARERGERLKKGQVMSNVKMFVQNVHHFRDECLIDTERPPIEHVVLFDEAQRAWDLQQTSNFMRRKKGKSNFDKSEPEFLISCMDRHREWAVVVCLVGGGQEINTGEAGISEWIDSLNRSFSGWDIYISSRMNDEEYASTEVLEKIKHRRNVRYQDDLHLAVSMRSFRAESVSSLVKQLLDLNVQKARQTLIDLNVKYPIILTRSISSAKKWLKSQARGSERYGIVVSSQAERLRPHAIDVRVNVNPIHWFLNGKEDVRSSYYLEDIATEFHIQGLELDWACIVWDGDLRYSKDGWQYRSFRGNKWQFIRKEERKKYLKNAYRVLLTRARQGMVIVVPEGDKEDPTRNPDFYDPTFEYLKNIGFKVI